MADSPTIPAMLEMLDEGPPSPGLLTDLYHPDAAYVAWRTGRNGVTTFDLYTRRAPFGGAYLLVAGLEAALAFVRAFRYSESDLRYLSQVRDYDPAFLEMLGRVRFTGEILAMPEGTIAFPDEPLLRVSAPFVEALLVESGLLQAINLATLLATKAARITTAAGGRRVAEFAFRRAQAPFTVARSAYIGGCASTSFVAAAERFRLPATGTIPHALVQLFDERAGGVPGRGRELQPLHRAARHLRRAAGHRHRDRGRPGGPGAPRPHPGRGAPGQRRPGRGQPPACGRRSTGPGCGRRASWPQGTWTSSTIADLVASGAPIDGFGVGTSLGVGAGSLAHEVEGGALGGVYKEVAYVDEDGRERPRIKLAGDKSTWPGRKEVYRIGALRGGS